MVRIDSLTKKEKSNVDQCAIQMKIQRKYLIKRFPFSYEQLYSFDTQDISDFLVEIA